MKLKYLIVCLLVVAAVAVFVSGAVVSENENAAGTSAEKGVRAGFSPAKLFDFENYKIIFHKTYSGFLEEMVRAKYFLSRAFLAFVSAIKYKYRKASYYLAVNQMSDWTPEELDKSKNKVLAEAHSGKTRNTRSIKEDEPEDDVPELLFNNVDELERELKRIADSVPPGSPGYEELKAVIGETVEAPSIGTLRAKVRNLPWEKLINSGAGVHLNAKAARKVVKDPESNNPAYKHLELPSFGLVDEQKNPIFWYAESLSQKDSRTEAIEQLLSGIFGESDTSATVEAILNDAYGDSREGNQPIAEEANLPDEVFVDHRRSNCFTTPRDQGKCGSCWAFATISILEWMHCRQTKELVEFSEQYMIDCGMKFNKDIDGCEGASGRNSAKFVKNFGVELRKHYPYAGRDTECPLDESTNLEETGYIRFDFDYVTQVPSGELANYLKFGPIWVIMATWPKMSQFGGGIYDQKCHGDTDHAVVLVGHGRKDGEEYWIIRNSWSATWGEGGYARFAKKSNCIQYDPGFIFGLRKDEMQPNIKPNKLHPKRIAEGRRKEKKSSYGKVDITELF